MDEQENNQQTMNSNPDETDSIIRQKADSLHSKIIDTQLEIIEALTKDKDKLTDHRHVRVLNEVLNGAATTSLGTKKLALDAQSNDQQKAMVAFMLSMAKAEPSTMAYVQTVVDKTKKTADTLEPVIDVDVKFTPGALVQGQRTITFEDIGKV